MEGKHATVGYVEFLRRPVPTTNAPLVKILLDAGAVLYCKTNLPQTMMVSHFLAFTYQMCSNYLRVVRRPTLRTTSSDELLTPITPTSPLEVLPEARVLCWPSEDLSSVLEVTLLAPSESLLSAAASTASSPPQTASRFPARPSTLFPRRAFLASFL